MLSKKNNGITLVALVITIVILLILAGISISALSNTGIFQKAKDAKKASENAEKEQNKTLDNYEKELDQYLPQKLVDKVNDGTIKVGDYISYTPDKASTEESVQELAVYSGTDANKTLTQEIDKETGLKWRVLDVKDGKVRLISDRPTSSTITLSGAKGYNNAVYLLDKICKTLYNNSKLASNVQNLKIEDIQDHLKYDYTKFENLNADTGMYGGTKEYKIKRFYPAIYANEKFGWIDGKQGNRLYLSNQDQPINETKKQAEIGIKATQTYWKNMMNINDFEEGYYGLFINKEKDFSTYWMSSRCVFLGIDNARFDIYIIHSDYVDARCLFDSGENEDSDNYSFRPCITLNSSVQLDTKSSKNGSIESPFNIE